MKTLNDFIGKKLRLKDENQSVRVTPVKMQENLILCIRTDGVEMWYNLDGTLGGSLDIEIPQE